MRWLIVEDALRDQTGHWFEFVGTFWRGLRQLGDEVTVLADQAAEPFLLKGLLAQPVLPTSIWHRMSDGASAWRRYLRVPTHAWLTYRRVASWLRANPALDTIFVPTVLVHHLLGWTALIKGPLRRTETRVLLFFMGVPIRVDPLTGVAAWVPAPTSRLLRLLIRSLKAEVQRGRVILGAETHGLSQALTKLAGVPFQYFPQPVEPSPEEGTGQLGNEIVMASYGGARHEKGDDLLIAAIKEYTHRFADSRVRFVFQCVGGSAEDWQLLERRSNVRLIPRYFEDGEYAKHLQATQVILLPYRKTSYVLRGSRVAVEAMVNGIPIVTTRGTALADQAEKYGAAVLCEDEDAESLIQAIRECEMRFDELRQLALSRMASAREHFSVVEFRRILLSLPYAPNTASEQQESRNPVASESGK